MEEGTSQARERAVAATGDELAALLHHPSAAVLLALLDNPALDESHLCLLLERKDLPGEVLEEVGKRKPLLKSYRVKKALCFHPHGPRLVTLRLIRPRGRDRAAAPLDLRRQDAPGLRGRVVSVHLFCAAG